MVEQGLVNPLILLQLESGLLDIEQGQREAERFTASRSNDILIGSSFYLLN